MHLSIEDAAARYDVSTSLIRRIHNIIASRDGFFHRSRGGSDRNIYLSETLDTIAAEGLLGHKAKLALQRIKETA